MLTELEFAREQMRQYKLFLAEFLRQAELAGLSKKEEEKMVNFMLDKILEVRERINQLEST